MSPVTSKSHIQTAINPSHQSNYAKPNSLSTFLDSDLLKVKFSCRPSGRISTTRRRPGSDRGPAGRQIATSGPGSRAELLQEAPTWTPGPDLVEIVDPGRSWGLEFSTLPLKNRGFREKPSQRLKTGPREKLRDLRRILLDVTPGSLV